MGKKTQTETHAVLRGVLLVFLLSGCFFGLANAHVSERALVLLLPTYIYIRAGTAAVAISFIILLAAPPALIRRVFSSWAMPALPRKNVIADVISLCSTAFLFLAIWVGFTGTGDPTVNMLPLLIWSVWWIPVPVIQAVFGDVWRMLNPWSGVARLIAPGQPLVQLPKGLGAWPAVIIFAAFSVFHIADIAPSDPTRLAKTVLCYWTITLAARVIFGPEWMKRGEAFSVLFHQFARLAPITNGRIGVPGHDLLAAGSVSMATGVLTISMLAAGSFDGLKGSFWWLGNIGINPLEFPGRSAVVWPNALAVLASIVVLAVIFYALTVAGLRLVKAPFSLANRLALAVLPIALGYHMAHYLTAFMVDIQYSLGALTDPLARGDDWLRLGKHHVTTGFFNSPDSVRMIWLAQASAIVAGHILAVLMAHAIALDALGSHRKAIISQAPLAVFMVAYTVFGLWLLATPTGA